MRLTGSVTTGKVLEEQVGGYVDGVKTQSRALIKEYAMKIAREAQARAPVKAGDLRGSITHVVEVRENGTIGYVRARADYAAYVEFGTGSKARVPPGLRDYAMTFYVNGLGHMPPSPYFFPALEAHREDLIADFRAMLKQPA